MYIEAWEANDPDYHQKLKRNKRAPQDPTINETAFDHDIKSINQDKQRNLAIVDKGTPGRERLKESRKEKGDESSFQDRIRQRNEEMRRFLS